MKKIFSCLVVLLLFVSVVSLDVNVSVYALSNKNEKVICNAKISDSFSKDRVLVVLNNSASSSLKQYNKNDFKINRCIDVKDLTKYKNTRSDNINENFKKVLSLELANGSKEYVLETITELIKREDVLYAGPDYEISIASTNPNDYNDETQWAINSLSLSQAWDFTTGANEIIVGVMDTGIDGTHPDLQGSIVNNLCRDFSSGEEVVVSSPVDPNGHGTHVAGIIGAIGNNNVGVTGVNWNVGLVSLRVFDENGNGYSSYVAEAIEYAERNGISILNLSARWYESAPRYDVALNTVINNYSGLMVCAAGNEGGNNDGNNPAYPASYSCDNIISVGSYDSNLNRSDFSNYGYNTVDIYAPGREIYSTLAGGTYGYMSGTSMATPYVTGVAALVASVSNSLSVAQVKDAILNSAETITISLPDGTMQNVKKLNAFNAIKYIISGKSSICVLNYNNRHLRKTIDSDSPYFLINTAMIRLYVQSEYDYGFSITSTKAINVTLYDYDLNVLAFSPTYYDENCKVEFSKALAIGNYYLRINYVDNTYYGVVTGTIYGLPHPHTYDGWLYHNNIAHIEVCACGAIGTRTSAHIVRSSEIVNQKANCLGCGYLLDLTKDVAMTFNSIRYSINGSYICSNGIIVLVDEDMDAYFAGMLVFYEEDKIPQFV